MSCPLGTLAREISRHVPSVSEDEEVERIPETTLGNLKVKSAILFTKVDVCSFYLLLILITSVNTEQ